MCSALQTLFCFALFFFLFVSSCVLVALGMSCPHDTRRGFVVCVVICMVAINGGSPRNVRKKRFCTSLTGSLLIRRILAGQNGVKETQECWDFPFAKPNAERDMTLKQVMSAGTELGGPKPYEENLNLMSCKMSSVSPTQAVGKSRNYRVTSMGRRVSL